MMTDAQRRVLEALAAGGRIYYHSGHYTLNRIGEPAKKVRTGTVDVLRRKAWMESRNSPDEGSPNWWAYEITDAGGEALTAESEAR